MTQGLRIAMMILALINAVRAKTVGIFPMRNKETGDMIFTQHSVWKVWECVCNGFVDSLNTHVHILDAILSNATPCC